MSIRAPIAPYRELAPCAPLRPFVACYWMRDDVDAPSDALPHRVLPDGCIDIIFDLADAAHGDDRAVVVGAMTAPILVDRAIESRMIGVRFRPGGAFTLLGVPALALTDRRIALEDVWGDRDATRERLAACAHDAERVLLLDVTLSRRLATERRDATVEAAVRRIFDARGRESVDDVAWSIGVTRQHLARRFSERVGVPPKTLLRIARLQHAIDALRRLPRGARPAWSVLALDCGYYDQAHLAAEFRVLVGRTPGEYFRERE